MQLPRSLVFSRTISLTGLILLALGANASPLPRDAAGGGEARAERRLSDADLALSDPRLELPDGSAGLQGHLLGAQGGHALVADGGSFDFGRVANPSGGSLQEMLRGFVTVRRPSASGPAGAQQARRGNHSADDSLGLDLGLTSNEWIRDSVQGMMTSILDLNVNERGHASFSVLGLGDFSVILSGDRSEIAFQAGDELIMQAQRTAHVQGSEGAYSRGYADGSSPAGGAAPAGSTESPIRRALNLIMEVASHPLSFILYGLVGAYLIVWGILSNRSRRPLGVASSQHGSSTHSLAYAARAAPGAVEPVAKKSRKRVRVRVRVRKHR